MSDFPNLAFDATAVDFGSCLSDTTRRLPVRITNSSAVDVVYNWAWDPDSFKVRAAACGVVSGGGVRVCVRACVPSCAPHTRAHTFTHTHARTHTFARPQEDANSMLSVSTKSRAPKPPAVQLFDVLPIKGVLRPGESELITFSFFAFPGVKATATAQCLVEGGPLYQVRAPCPHARARAHVRACRCAARAYMAAPAPHPLPPSLNPLAPFALPRTPPTTPTLTPQVTMAGESNNIRYSVEPQFVDLGQQLYDKPAETEITITNQVRAAVRAVCGGPGGTCGGLGRACRALQRTRERLGQLARTRTPGRAHTTATAQGKVPFPFSINTRCLSRPSVVTVSPREGVVSAGAREVVKLRVCAGVPDRLLETIHVELAHFDPISVQVRVGGGGRGGRGGGWRGGAGGRAGEHASASVCAHRWPVS